LFAAAVMSFGSCGCCFYGAAFFITKEILMANNYLDRSNYLKGLLLLIGKDKKITVGERDFLHTAGKTLSFDKRFIENAINELFENKYYRFLHVSSQFDDTYILRVWKLLKKYLTILLRFWFS
jgi:hypothetical protein